MYPDMFALQAFYRTPLGQLAAATLGSQLRAMWPQVRGLRLVGFGYATPYLPLFLDEAASCVALMPAPQGAAACQAPTHAGEGASRCTLVDETALPLADESVDRLLLVHTLEHTEHRGDLLDEMWRVLAGNGRLMVVLPHRSGAWAHSPRTPFGAGFSFSFLHSKRLLAYHGFHFTRLARALFVPPQYALRLQAYTKTLEKQMNRFMPALAGVMVLECSKQVYIPLHKPKQAFARPSFFNPLPKPAPKPVLAAIRSCLWEK